jgi:hypothetical protein
LFRIDRTLARIRRPVVAIRDLDRLHLRRDYFGKATADRSRDSSAVISPSPALSAAT